MSAKGKKVVNISGKPLKQNVHKLECYLDPQWGLIWKVVVCKIIRKKIQISQTSVIPVGSKQVPPFKIKVTKITV